MYVAVVPPSYRSNPILDELHTRLGTIEARLGQYARVTHSASYEAGRFQASTVELLGKMKQELAQLRESVAAHHARERAQRGHHTPYGGPNRRADTDPIAAVFARRARGTRRVGRGM